MRWVVAAIIIMLTVTAARAERRRVAVLAFEGPSGETIRGELVRIVQRSHTVVALAAWKRTAKSLGATKATASNIKRVAKKLGVDAVIEAETDKRSGGFRVRIRLRSGETGRAVDELVVATTRTSFDKAAQRDIRNELIDVISTLDDDDEPRKRSR